MVWYEVKAMDGNKKKKKDNMKKEKDINIKKIDGTNDKKKKVKNKDVYLEEGIVSEDISLNKTKGSKRSTFNLVEVIIIMFITTLFGLLLGGFIAYVKLDERDVSCSAIRKDMVEFAGVYDDLLNEYYGEIDKEELMSSAIKGMISYLEDPYSSYIDSMDAELLDEELSGSFVGIGVEIVSVDDQLPVVTMVYENGPASKAGVEVGDVLYKVDGKDLTGFSVLEISSFIKTDEPGKSVAITVLRNGEEKSFDIVRDVIEIDSVFLSYDESEDSHVGIIAITSFAKNTVSQFREAYEEALNNGVTSLVIDLRNNSGGYLSSARDIADLFLDEGMIIYQKDTKGKIEVFKAESIKEIDMDVVILVNGATASASEVFTAALKENLNVPVVGVKTYGKGTIQKLHELSDGSYVKYTVQAWLTPNGNRIEKDGITPTVEVELSDAYYENSIAANDNQLQQALELLR